MLSWEEKDIIVINECEYKSLLETLYLLSDPIMKEKIETAKNAIAEDYDIFEW